MTYHIIPETSIPLSDCTAEQVIAYKLASDYGNRIRTAYIKAPMQLQRCDIIHDAIRLMLKEISIYEAWSLLDVDSVFCCLNAGLEKFIELECPTFERYSDVARIFPADYLRR